MALFDLAGMVFSSPALDVAMTSNVTNVDNAGDTIVFTYTVTNTGNSTLSGITVTDDRGRNPARQTDTVGDNDNLLEFGERWRYTVSYTVVQADLAAGLDLVSVATADSDQTAADTDDVVVHNLFAMPQITIGDVTIRAGHARQLRDDVERSDDLFRSRRRRVSIRGFAAGRSDPDHS